MAYDWLAGKEYYWVADQVEYSSDLLFTNPAALRELYSRLLDHAIRRGGHFSAEDVLSFLGRRLHPRFDGEVLTDCKKKREPGARVKHRVKDNWLKMYDKFGLILRVETVINSPREFQVRRCRERQGVSSMVWCPMNKGVSSLSHCREVWLIFGEDALARSTAPFPPRGVGCVIWRTGFENSDDVDGQVVVRVALAWATFRNWSRYGQLDERRITMRRAETTTSHATLIRAGASITVVAEVARLRI